MKTSKGFRPYGTAYKLPIIGRAHVTLTAEAGAKISTWVYVVKDKKEQSLLGKDDGERLGIIKAESQGCIRGGDKPNNTNSKVQTARNRSVLEK